VKRTVKLAHFFLWLVIAAPGWGGRGAMAAERIVSINLCTDQLLLLLAPVEQISSVSFMAANPRYSAYAERVGEIPLNHARVEEVVAFDPDLVLAYEFSDHRLVQLLRELGYRVEQVRGARSLADVAAVIADTAALLEQRAAGREVLAAMSRQLDPGRPAPAASRPLAVIYAPNGYSPGAKTLPGAVLEAAGFDNLSAILGNEYGAQIPLEQLLRHQPALYIIDDEEQDMNSLAQKKLRHPALGKSIAASATATIEGHLWSCPTPMIARAVAELRDLR
jgi:iron complex transport system substrate-binding protein